MDTMDLLIDSLFALFAYMLGSVSGSLVLGRARGLDIRKSGSGSAGGTNAYRVAGLKFGLAVVLFDLGKGVLAIAVPVFLKAVPMDSPWLAVYAFCAVMGHIFPVFHQFRGGKGVATLVGCLVLLMPWVLMWMSLFWLLIILLTGYVGLASVLSGMLMMPLVALLYSGAHIMQWVVFSIVMALVILLAHRQNLIRMSRGEEVRLFRLWGEKEQQPDE